MRSLFFLLLSLPFFTHAQINNLVANPSFEDYLYCPANTAEIESASPWFQPLQFSTTDYFNACCSIPDFSGHVGVPLNGVGFQYARTGNAYAGFLFYHTGPSKEYLEGELNEPLKPNNKYCVEFYYNISNSAHQDFFVSSLGIYFSNDPVLSDLNINIPVVPQVSGFTINDTANWIKISGSFIAIGGEKYLLLGNFVDNFTQDGGVYAYIDDVSVYLCDDTIPKPKELNIPNVFTPQQDGLNELFFIENLPENSHLVIYNRWGQPVLDEANYKNNWDAHDVSAGVYYYILTLPGGERRKGFVEVVK